MLFPSPHLLICPCRRQHPHEKRNNACTPDLFCGTRATDSISAYKQRIIYAKLQIFD